MASYCVWTALLYPDTFVDHPAERMEVDGKPDDIPAVQLEAQIEVDRAVGRSQTLAAIPRQIFYERAKKAYCIIITGESRGWGCFILRKGANLGVCWA
jgi:L-fucose mutarotase